MPDLLVTRSAVATVTAGELSGVLVPWETPATVADGPDSRPYVESWARGSVVPGADRLPVYDGHAFTAAGLVRGELIGAVVDVTSGPDGLTGRVELAATPGAQRVRELARLVGAHFSVEVLTADDSPTDGGPVVRTDGLLTALAVILPPSRPAYPTAQVTTVRSSPVTMTDIPPQPAPDPEPDPAPAGPDPEDRHPALVARGELGEIVRHELARYGGQATRVTVSPLAQYGTLAEAARAAYRDPTTAAVIARALADQITGNNPGVVPPAWVSEVAGIVNQGRPVIDAIGTTPPGDHGMTIDYPYFAGDLMALVGVQATQKTAITSVRVDLLKGSAPLLTFAGGSDLALQLIERSQPSYLDAYLRIMYAAYAAVTDNYAADQLVALGDGYELFAPGTGTVDLLRSAIFAASVKVQKATGSPASVVLAAEDVFVKFGSALLPGPIFNQSGTAAADTLDVSVSGLQIVYAPGLAAGTAVVTNRQAAGWAEVGPSTITALDVEKLGNNVAVWGMGALVVPVPLGVVILAATPPAGDEPEGGTRRASKT